jgi:predicted O-methyltransferase YrrM
MKLAIYEAIVGRLPPDIAGSIDYRIGHHSFFYPWGGPMNGQAARLELVRAIVEAVKPEAIVETGSYRGTTTEWLSEFGRPVQSVEINPRYHAFTRRRLAHRRNVAVRLGNSVEFLRAETAQTPGATKLYYLDSHWQDHLPLREELELIFAGSDRAVVVIDDFKVEEDAGYTYDDYGPAKALTLSYVVSAAIPDVHVFFPIVAASAETGQRRGCVVLTASAQIAGVLAPLPMLRSYGSAAVACRIGGRATG